MQEILTVNPRGFCAGVDRAIDIVRLALNVYDKPVYVRHEIVHNKHVVERLERQGATFVETLDEVPDDALVIFSAHGIPERVLERAKDRGLEFLDATCPLVTKVHLETKKYHRKGYTIVLIGHEGHPEVEGTLGQVPDRIHLVEDRQDVHELPMDADDDVAYVTQTTLSMDDTRHILEELTSRYPGIEGPSKEDICYATQNRQNAVKHLCERVEFNLVVGAPNSSNTNRLVEVSREQGTPAQLVQEASEVDLNWLQDVDRVGLTAGASAPEDLVQGVISFLKQSFAGVSAREIDVIQEDVEFELPEPLREARAS